MFQVFRQYYPIRNIIFVTAESILIFLSLFAAFMLFDFEGIPLDWSYILFNIFFITVLFQTCFYYTDLYEIKVSFCLKELVKKLFYSLLIAILFLGLIYLIFPSLMIKPEIFAIGLMIMIIMILSGRFLYGIVLEKGLFNQHIMLIGTGDLVTKIINEIKERPDCGYHISYIIKNKMYDETSPTTNTPTIQNTNYLNICETAKEKGIKMIVVAIKEKRGNFPSAELLKCRIAGCKILDGNSFYEMLSGKLIVNELYPSWLIFSDGFHKTLMRKVLKRCFDVVLSMYMLIIFLPLMLLVAVLIKIDSRGPVFYSQGRVGQNHRTYNIHKFRSMIDHAEQSCGPQYACENDPRITRIGKVLRKFRIDEIPQLWNVLKGEMSFVGPRPERVFFVEEYEKEIPYYRERFSIKPGITGWAQICYQYGANAEETTEKLNYDLFYIKNMSILMDIMIVLKTIKIVIFGQGAR
jgi:sugar transferase (PEP-CTERM system associated)